LNTKELREQRYARLSDLPKWYGTEWKAWCQERHLDSQNVILWLIVKFHGSPELQKEYAEWRISGKKSHQKLG
jgi:hypothetical protein